jgi:hypothetical protein
MPTNFYFNPFPSSQVTSEQLLVEDLVIESMQINGMDVYYLPRHVVDSVDMLYGEDPIKEYRTAFPIEMYLENVTGMEGDQDFISKFGLEVRDEVHLLMSRRRFRATVPLQRPREGDLVFISLLKNFFEITFVEHENDQAMFHTLGRGRDANVYVYAMRLKQYEFSEEVIDTGVTEIDDNAVNYYKRTKLVLAANVGIGSFTPGEVVYQGANLSSAIASATVHSYVPHSEVIVIRTRGTFGNTTLIGVTSAATRNVTTDVVNYSDIYEDIADNDRIQDEWDDIIDFTETNPFGTP